MTGLPIVQFLLRVARNTRTTRSTVGQSSLNFFTSIVHVLEQNGQTWRQPATLKFPLAIPIAARASLPR